MEGAEALLMDRDAVWGLYTRLLGCVYIIAIGALWHQVLPWAGSKGMTPIAAVLDRYRTDFPSLPQRLAYFPTLLWLSPSDTMLKALVGTGTASALALIAGGPHSQVAAAVCWACLQSLGWS